METTQWSYQGQRYSLFFVTTKYLTKKMPLSHKKNIAQIIGEFRANKKTTKPYKGLVGGGISTEAPPQRYSLFL